MDSVKFRGSLPVAFLIIIACSTGRTDRVESTETDKSLVDVTLTLDPNIRGRRLNITGTTNLIDGAIIVYEVRHERWSKAGEQQWLREGQMLVKDGGFSTRVRLGSWPAGTLNIWCAFQTVLPKGRQPEELLAIFGEMGKKIGGPHVSQLGQMRRAELTVQIQR
jgi:hypothetical protein